MLTPTIPGPDPDTRIPKFELPPLACDAHCHIFGPGAKYPYAPDRPYTPPDAPLEDFRALHAKLGVGRAVIVNASVHGTDNRVALDAIAVSGGAYRAVANLDDGITRARIARACTTAAFAAAASISCAISAACPTSAMFERVIDMMAPLGWHIDLHFDAIDLPEYADMLARLPVRYTIDHMGRVKAADGLDQLPFRTLIELMQRDEKCCVKVCGCERVSSAGPPVYRCGAVRAQDRRDRAGSRHLGHRLAASQRQGDAERRRPRRPHSAVRAGAGAAAEDTGR